MTPSIKCMIFDGVMYIDDVEITSANMDRLRQVVTDNGNNFLPEFRSCVVDAGRAMEHQALVNFCDRTGLAVSTVKKWIRRDTPKAEASATAMMHKSDWRKEALANEKKRSRELEAELFKLKRKMFKSDRRQKKLLKMILKSI